jgi:NTP pyrophosphatase (non-canonical NTP hydrolase)
MDGEQNMTLNEYQRGCLDTWGGPHRLERAFLAIAEEAGEVVGKYQKYLRGDFSQNETKSGHYVMRDAVKKELGDLLCYLSVTAYELGMTLEEVAEANRQKLRDRKERGVLFGSGDDR